MFEITLIGAVAGEEVLYIVDAQADCVMTDEEGTHDPLWVLVEHGEFRPPEYASGTSPAAAR